MTIESEPSPEDSANIRSGLIKRLTRWSLLGGCEGDPEWELVSSLSEAERLVLKHELERAEDSIRRLLDTLSSADDDLYRP